MVKSLPSLVASLFMQVMSKIISGRRAQGQLTSPLPCQAHSLVVLPSCHSHVSLTLVIA